VLEKDPPKPHVPWLTEKMWGEFFRISKVQPDENGVSLSQHMDFMCPFLPPCSPFTRHNGGVFLGLPDLTWAT
jgi:hypothetical protein